MSLEFFCYMAIAWGFVALAVYGAVKLLHGGC